MQEYHMNFGTRPASGGHHRPPASQRPRGGAPPPYRPPSPRKKRQKRNRRLALLAIVMLVVLVAGFSVFFLSRRSGPPWTIALDAGHGGDDVGAIGQIEEVALTEATTAQLQALLEADENFNPVLCRPLGKGAGVNARSNKARRRGAHLLLSIHGNSSEDASAAGFECYPTPPGRKVHSDSLRFAQLLAEQMGAAGATLRGEGGVRYLYYAEDGSKVFAEASDTAERDEKSFGVVENAGCPAVLAEQCFITNPADLAAFGTEEGSARAAACYYRAICAYFGTTPTSV